MRSVPRYMLFTPISLGETACCQTNRSVSEQGIINYALIMHGAFGRAKVFTGGTAAAHAGYRQHTVYDGATLPCSQCRCVTVHGVLKAVANDYTIQYVQCSACTSGSSILHGTCSAAAQIGRYRDQYIATDGGQCRSRYFVDQANHGEYHGGREHRVGE